MGSAAVGTGAVFGTGAFTSVEADRGASFTVVGDSSGYLTLDGDGDYVTRDGTGSQGQTVIQITADSLNDDAVTVLGQVTITNNTSDSDSKWVYVKSSGNLDGTVVDFQADQDQDTNSSGSNNVTAGDSIVGSGNNVEVAVGSNLTVEIEVDTSAGDPSGISTVTFAAEDTDQSG